MLVLLPVTFTVYNIIGLFHEYDEDQRNDMWCFTLAVGFIDSLLYMSVLSSKLTFSEWNEPIAEGALHGTVGAAWTETTDWTLSQKTRPQDIHHVDEYGYYLEN